MSRKKTLKVAILIGRSGSLEALGEDVWRLAIDAVAPSDYTLQGLLAYSGQKQPRELSSEALELVHFESLKVNKFVKLAEIVAEKTGATGVIGRLWLENLESRRLHRAFSDRRDLRESFCEAAVIVALDVPAIRAVWSLRKRTDAQLMSGAGAMVHAIRQIGRESSSVW